MAQGVCRVQPDWNLSLHSKLRGSSWRKANASQLPFSSRSSSHSARAMRSSEFLMWICWPLALSWVNSVNPFQNGNLRNSTETTENVAIGHATSDQTSSSPGENSERIFPIFGDSTVRFYLFAGQRSGSGEIFIGNPASLRKANFSSSNPTKVLVHGYRKNAFSDFPHFVKNAYLAYGYEFNIICVDWKRLASDRIYLNSAYNTRFVAERVGELLVFLKDQKFVRDFRQVHIIGFSLGAQLSGYVGKYVQTQRNLKIGRITGLDPAGPGFTGPNSENRLDKNDAEFVDVIHTSVKSGLHTAIGSTDFFPNGGDYQPGCSFEYFVDPVLGGCSHQRSFELYIESIRGTQLYGCQCGNWTLFEGNECRCDNPSRLNLMGEHTNQKLKGSFYLRTGSAPPYLL